MTEGTATEHPPRRHTGLLVWWGVLVLVLPLELVAATVAFDAPLDAWDRVGGWVAWVFHWKHRLSYFAVTGLAAWLMLAGRPLLDRLRSQFSSDSAERPGRAGWLWLATHAASFAGFFALTGMIFRRAQESWSSPGLVFVTWIALGGVLLATWCLAALPWHAWSSLHRECRLAPAAGLVVGVIAAGLAPAFEQSLWARLDTLTLQFAHALLREIAEPVCDPEQQLLGIPPFVVTISPQCSGIEGILLIWIFLAAYLWFWRDQLHFPRAWLLVPLATVVIWFLNALRIVALICLGRWVSEEVALKSFHSQAGWIAFNVVALGLVWGTQQLGYFRREPQHPAARPEELPNPVVAYVAPFTAIVATTMVTSALAAGGMDRLYPLRILAAGMTLWCLSRRPTSLRLSFSWSAVGIGVLVYVLWMAAELVNGAGDGSVLRSRLASLPTAWAAAWVVFRVLGSTLVVPLAEELAFRGFLVRRLISANFESISPRRFTWLSFVGSSILFGSLHGSRWFAGMLAGMLYAGAVYRRGELADAVLAHAVTNGLIAVTVLGAGYWVLWT